MTKIDEKFYEECFCKIQDYANQVNEPEFTFWASGFVAGIEYTTLIASDAMKLPSIEKCAVKVYNPAYIQFQDNLMIKTRDALNGSSNE